MISTPRRLASASRTIAAARICSRAIEWAVAQRRVAERVTLRDPEQGAGEQLGADEAQGSSG